MKKKKVNDGILHIKTKLSSKDLGDFAKMCKDALDDPTKAIVTNSKVKITELKKRSPK